MDSIERPRFAELFRLAASGEPLALSFQVSAARVSAFDLSAVAANPNARSFAVTNPWFSVVLGELVLEAQAFEIEMV